MKQVFESENIRFVELSDDLIPDYLVMINDYEHVQRLIHRTYKPRAPYTEEQEKTGCVKCSKKTRLLFP